MRDIKNIIIGILGILIFGLVIVVFSTARQTSALKKINKEYEDSIKSLHIQYAELELRKQPIINKIDSTIVKIQYVKEEFHKDSIAIINNSCSEDYQLFTDNCNRIKGFSNNQL